MKLLLTSGGITNESIRQALIELLGKPIAQATALCIPTAMYAEPNSLYDTWQMLRQFEIGWQRYGVLELTALPGLPEALWLPAVESADVLLVGGGVTAYLSYWLQTSGLADKLPALLKNKVYVGASAGSMVVTHHLTLNQDELAQTGIYYDDNYEEAAPRHLGSNKTVRLVDFIIRPHLNADSFPRIIIANLTRQAAQSTVPLYAIDDQTALKVVDGCVEVISEGEWRLFAGQ